MTAPPPTAQADRISRLCARVMLTAASRGWVPLGPAAPFAVDPSVPSPVDPNGFEIDTVTGLGLGWDGTATGLFGDREGRPVAFLCAWWGYPDWNPAPGERGFQEWLLFDDGDDRLGIMVVPRTLC